MADIKEPGYKLGELLVAVHAAFSIDEKARSDQINKVNGIFQLRAKKDGKEAVWTIDLKKDGKVSKGVVGSKPDVIISASDDIFIQISQGKLSGQKAFMTGKLKAKGNIMLATKMEGILGVAKGKAKL